MLSTKARARAFWDEVFNLEANDTLEDSEDMGNVMPDDDRPVGTWPPSRYEPELSTIWAISTKSIVGATPYRPVTRSRSSSEKKLSAASFESQT